MRIGVPFLLCLRPNVPKGALQYLQQSPVLMAADLALALVKLFQQGEQLLLLLGTQGLEGVGISDGLALGGLLSALLRQGHQGGPAVRGAGGALNQPGPLQLAQ